MLILGVDPGSNGALALWDLDRRGLTKVEAVYDIPTYGEGPQRRVDGSALFKTLVDWPIARAFVELVTAMPSAEKRLVPPPIEVVDEDEVEPGVGHNRPPSPPIFERRGMGTASAFKFGRMTGAVESVIEAVIGRRVDLITPLSWKKMTGLIKQDKEASRALALKKWPELAPALSRVKDQNRAEAVLIGWCGAMICKTDLDHERRAD